MKEMTAVFEFQLSQAQTDLNSTRAAVAKFLPENQENFLKFYQRLADPTQKHPFLRYLSVEGVFAGKPKKKKAPKIDSKLTAADPYDVRKANLRRSAMSQYREHTPESLDREVAKQAAAGFSLLLQLLDRDDLVPCFLEHVTEKTAVPGAPIDRFKSYRKKSSAQDMFGVIQLAVHCGMATPTEPTALVRNQQLNLFAASVAYAQTRLGQIMDQEDTKKNPRYDHINTKEQRRVSRDQILIFALTQLHEVKPQLLNYLLHLHYSNIDN